MLQVNSLEIPGLILIDDERVELFNAASSRMQKQAGINPADCMSIGAAAGEARTLLPIFFGALQKRLWITPVEGQWLDHDISLHWPGVRRLHPNSVNVVMQAAAAGEEMVKNGDKSSAVTLGNAIDLFVDRGMSESRYQSVIEKSDITDAPDYATQSKHEAAMIGLEISASS